GRFSSAVADRDRVGRHQLPGRKVSIVDILDGEIRSEDGRQNPDATISRIGDVNVPRRIDGQAAQEIELRIESGTVVATKSTCPVSCYRVDHTARDSTNA